MWSLFLIGCLLVYKSAIGFYTEGIHIVESKFRNDSKSIFAILEHLSRKFTLGYVSNKGA